MKRYSLTRFAEDDVNEIWAFIAVDSIKAAGEVERAILETCVFLSKNPRQASLRPDITKRNLRFWTLPRYPNYTIVCVPGTRPLQIVAVLHGRRNARNILGLR